VDLARSTAELDRIEGWFKTEDISYGRSEECGDAEEDEVYPYLGPSILAKLMEGLGDGGGAAQPRLYSNRKELTSRRGISWSRDDFSLSKGNRTKHSRSC
jgi:hypothetical protein